jgi:hypothetical protein
VTLTLSIILAVLPLLVLLVKRWLTRKDARESSGEAKRDEIHKAIAKGDERSVSVLLDDALRRMRAVGMRNPDPGDPKRPGGDKAPGA